MEMGMIGLGRMGANMAARLARAGHALVVYNRDREKAEKVAREIGARAAATVETLVHALDRPRAVWLMLPAGEATEAMMQQLGGLLDVGDAVIDGGNTYFKDDAQRARAFGEIGVHYLDVGTSGGVWGAERGYCLMIGGEDEVVQRLEPIFRALAPGRGEIPRTEGREARGGTAEEGFLHCGPAGAGHFVKMVHNGIEYGMMQAYAEGFDILKNASSDALPEDLRYEIDLADVAEVWRRGSVVGSWLLDLTAMALAESPELSEYEGRVADSGEGRWTVQAAIDESVPASVLTAALFARFRSRKETAFADKVLSAMRQKFGGHVEPRAES